MAKASEGRQKVEAAAQEPGSAKDPEQYQRFLETARQLGLDPTTETDLSRLDPVVRCMAKMPPQCRGPLRDDAKPDDDDGKAG
jgi:hypothetical protein